MIVMSSMKEVNAVNPMKDKKPGVRQPAGESVEEFLIDYLATTLGVSVRTVKNWEKNKWIPVARRNNFNWRIYNQTEIDGIVETVKKNNFFTNKRTFATSRS
jgi:DNA-binding XRE family transcriptional regulator